MPGNGECQFNAIRNRGFGRSGLFVIGLVARHRQWDASRAAIEHELKLGAILAQIVQHAGGVGGVGKW